MPGKDDITRVTDTRNGSKHAEFLKSTYKKLLKKKNNHHD